MLMNWSKGDVKIFTSRIDVAKKAVHDGQLVRVIKPQCHVYGL
jgi:hypothetical protein